jgi:hypothetical protein
MYTYLTNQGLASHRFAHGVAEASALTHDEASIIKREREGHPDGPQRKGTVRDQRCCRRPRRAAEQSVSTYKALWLGWPDDEVTWEPAESFAWCPAVLKPWQENSRKRPAEQGDNDDGDESPGNQGPRRFIGVSWDKRKR